MKLTKILTETLGNLIMALNLLSGIIGGIWLLYLGQWKVLLCCVLSAAFADSILMWPLMLGFVFSIPATAAEQNGNHRSLIFWAAVSTFYKTVLMVAWASFSLIILCELAVKKGLPIMPFLLCSYGVATIPWAGMAEKEVDVSGYYPGLALTMYLSIGYFFAMGAIVCGANYAAIIAIISLFCLAGNLVNLIQAAHLTRGRK